VGPRAGLDAVEKGKIPSPYRISSPTTKPPEVTALSLAIGTVWEEFVWFYKMGLSLIFDM
jgi:hypothetical protein